MRNRILLIGEYGIINGGENSLLAIAPGLIKRGWELTAAVPANSEFANQLKTLGIETVDFSTLATNGTRKTQAEIRQQLADLIKDQRPEIVHCNSLATSRLCGPVTQTLGQASIGYLRDILKLSRQAIQDLNQVDRLITVSNATKHWHVEQGLEAARTQTIYNGVDSDRFRPRLDAESFPIRERLKIPTDVPIVLFVGQIGMRKGVDVLIEAFIQMANTVTDARLFIVGQRNSQKAEAIEFEQRLIERTSQSSCSSNIHWLGRRGDVDALMRESTLLVHPARQEPLGRVLLESCASGLPLVTTRVGGSAEILNRPSFDDLLLSPDAPEALAKKMIELRNDPDRRSRLAIELRELALERFSIAQCVEKLDREYQAVRKK